MEGTSLGEGRGASGMREGRKGIYKTPFMEERFTGNEKRGGRRQSMKL